MLPLLILWAGFGLDAMAGAFLLVAMLLAGVGVNTTWGGSSSVSRRQEAMLRARGGPRPFPCRASAAVAAHTRIYFARRREPRTVVQIAVEVPLKKGEGVFTDQLVT